MGGDWLLVVELVVLEIVLVGWEPTSVLLVLFEISNCIDIDRVP